MHRVGQLRELWQICREDCRRHCSHPEHRPRMRPARRPPAALAYGTPRACMLPPATASTSCGASLGMDTATPGHLCFCLCLWGRAASATRRAKFHDGSARAYHKRKHGASGKREAAPVAQTAGRGTTLPWRGPAVLPSVDTSPQPRSCGRLSLRGYAHCSMHACPIHGALCCGC